MIETPWSILLEMMAFFIENYVDNGKVTFSWVHFTKNYKAICKVIEFFKALYTHFFGDDNVQTRSKTDI